ncbi:response regulator [Acidothermaceae bacterium B102]|nr:response regulator [Acidothermaceae bacterium B102]
MADWRVLIVDGDTQGALMLRRIVCVQPGFVVVGIASTSEEAYAIVQRGVPIDLILLDSGLPKANGVTLLKALRKHGGPEVIAVTSAREPRVMQELLHLGVVDYLLKPFAVERLQEALLRFGDRMRAFNKRGELEQWQIDLLYSHPRRSSLPKNLQQETLDAVRLALRRAGEDFASAEEVARVSAMARVTARRYLEHLVNSQQAEVDVCHGGPGRPRKLYRLMALNR